MESNKDIKNEFGLINPINDEDDYEDKKYDEQVNKPNTKKKLIIIISVITLITIIIAVVIIFFLNKGEDDEKVKDDNTDSDEQETDKEEEDEDINKEIIGEIKCQFDIKNVGEETKILENEFVNSSRIDIYINGKKILYSKTYKFENVGYYKIEIKIYDNLNMDYMFTNISDLNKIEMSSNKSCKILSMISTFENCISLDEFKISGFDMSYLKSMKKLFYKTNINQNISFLSFNSINLEDISYMFSYTPIKEFKLEGINTEKVIDMSHLFEGCSFLINVNLKGFTTKNVKDISYMFNSCIKISQIDLNILDTSEIINMSNLFQNCISLKNIYLNETNINKVENMSN